MPLESILNELEKEIDTILRKNFDKRLYYPKREDSIRLLKLRVWENRYKVTLEYILGVLIPHFAKMSERFRRKVSSGIGTTIPILTGQAAEEFLKLRISKDFPNNENVLDWKERYKTICLKKIKESEGTIPSRKSRGVLQFKSVNAFLKAYEAKIEAARKEDRIAEKSLAKQPWRGNPWR
jgi:hypothetical protein